MEMILEWVKSGLLFSIFASVILMLSPNRSYSKHISMVVGMLFILVMVHPVMELLQLDEQTYVSYIENFLELESEEGELSEEDVELYEESVNLQLMAALNESGYSVKNVMVQADASGVVSEVHLVLGNEVTGIEHVELYLKNLFGEEVEIYFEAG